MRTCEPIGLVLRACLTVTLSASLCGPSFAQNTSGNIHADRARTAAMLARADDLLAAATSIAADTPSTRMEAAEMVRGSEGPAGQFYDRDRKFQDDLGNPKPLSIRDDNSRSAMLQLIQAESFLYGTVADAVGGCNKRDALLNLKVAKADIAEAHLEFIGKGKDDYEPPDIDTDGRVRCSE